jgi:hypothetical protein
MLVTYGLRVGGRSGEKIGWTRRGVKNGGLGYASPPGRAALNFL